MDHLSFTVGKNMDYFKDVLTIVDKYNGGKSTQEYEELIQWKYLKFKKLQIEIKY